MYKKLKGICLYCLGCNRLELEDFEGVNRCGSFYTYKEVIFSDKKRDMERYTGI